jgi:flavin reductase (DIM6/NTAB) family NADH-FMN oxidoreductase RutF
MAVAADEFRRALARLAGGVTVVTSRGLNGSPYGLTATAVASVSLDPPLVMACIDRQSHTHTAIETSGLFALNFLRGSQEELARRFASRRDDKFIGIGSHTAETGAPILTDALAWCDCSLEQAVPAGDHTIFVGRVQVAAAAEDDDRPLVYYLGAYANLEGV